jgi:hypothetical protein
LCNGTEFYEVVRENAIVLEQLFAVICSGDRDEKKSEVRTINNLKQNETKNVDSQLDNFLRLDDLLDEQGYSDAISRADGLCETHL